MSQAVKISNELVTDAKISSAACNRSLAKQVEYWARIGKIAEENPEMNFTLIADLLLSLQQKKMGMVDAYKFDS